MTIMFQSAVCIIINVYHAAIFVGGAESSLAMDGKNVVCRVARVQYCQIDHWSTVGLRSFVEETTTKWLQREVSLQGGNRDLELLH